MEPLEPPLNPPLSKAQVITELVLLLTMPQVHSTEQQ